MNDGTPIPGVQEYQQRLAAAGDTTDVVGAAVRQWQAEQRRTRRGSRTQRQNTTQGSSDAAAAASVASDAMDVDSHSN